MSFAKAAVLVVVLGLLAGVGFVYSGQFDPAADTPHSAPVYWLMESLRHRGIAMRVRNIEVPDLTDPELVRSGAGNYNAMCTDCHLKPGVTDSEMHRGLYPQPPALAATTRTLPPDHAFWIIKHGIKASGMPAWGKSLDDPSIWGLVAFVQKLPALSAGDYDAAVAQSRGHSHGGAAPVGPPADEEHDDGHDHGHEDDHE